jgi:protein-S-isoprenylcysteine O-methyltransferase Ste14
MPGNPLTDPNWAPDLADQITAFVGNVRDKTTNNAIKAVRAVVFGLLASILGIALVVLSMILLTRGVQALLSIGTSWERAVYLSYFIIGGLLTLAGMLLMKLRHGSDA